MSAVEPGVLHAAEALGSGVTSVGVVEGGNIARAWRLALEDRRVVFVKTGYALPAQFRAEATGLRELATCRAIQVPEVLAVGDDFLALAFVSRGRMGLHYSELLGRGLAEMHRMASTTFGFREDNFIGATPQRNAPPVLREQGWAHFFWEYRLLPQWRKAEAAGLPDPRTVRMFARLEGRMDDWLGRVGEPPVLLHGDLWGGNAIVSPSGDPVLIDPAVYYGHRETDLAMMRLFGGLPERVYRAYEEIHPLAPGAADRQGLYQLYHLMNHWNLFGQSYADAVMAMLNRYAR